MSDKILQLTDSGFEESVINAAGPVLVDFWAEWCGPCKMLMPIVEQISSENDTIKVCKVDIDNNPELVAKYNIQSVPTLIAIKNGEVSEVFNGIKSKDAILGMFN